MADAGRCGRLRRFIAGACLGHGLVWVTGLPSFEVMKFRETAMFTGLKRALLLITAMFTLLPWGIMQAVQ